MVRGARPRRNSLPDAISPVRGWVLNNSINIDTINSSNTSININVDLSIPNTSMPNADGFSPVFKKGSFGAHGFGKFGAYGFGTSGFTSNGQGQDTIQDTGHNPIGSWIPV